MIPVEKNGKCLFQSGNLPEYYFDNEFPADTKAEEMLSAQKPEAAADDEVFAEAEADVDAEVDAEINGLENDVEEELEKAIDDKDFDK
jgi:cbb3-type cytochrome oxidase cytochrome c subunit